MVRLTWEDRDLPVLRAIVELIEETGDQFVEVEAIVDRSGFDGPDTQRALFALAGADPPFFGHVERAHLFGADEIDSVSDVTERARRAVGLWPTPVEFADRLIDALNAAEQEAATEEKRVTLRDAKHAIGRLSRDVFVEVVSAAIMRT